MSFHIQSKMHVDDRLERIGRHQPRHKLGGDPGWCRQDHVIARREGEPPCGEAQRGDAVVRDLQGAHPRRKTQRAAARLEPGDGGVDEAFRQSLPRHQRHAGATALQQRALHHRPHQGRQSRVGRGVEAGDGERLQQAAIELGTAQHLRHGCARPGEAQARQSEVVAQAGVRHAAGGQPPGQAAIVRLHRPMLAGGAVEEREERTARPMHAVLGADRAQEAHRGVVAGQQQVVAVVDPHAERAVEIRAAASAGGGARLVEGDGAAGLGRGHGGGQARQPGADDVDVAHSTPYRNAIHSLRHFGTRTGCCSRVQPRASRRSRIAA